MLAIILSLLIASAGSIALSRYNSAKHRRLRRYYIAQILSGGTLERYIAQIDTIKSNSARIIAAEAIAYLSSIIYRIDESPLLELSRALELERFLIARASKGSLFARIDSLLLLSQIPTQSIIADDIEQFRDDKNRMVRFLAMMCLINAESNNITHHIAAYKERLTPLEVSYIVETLRRGTITVAYQPLLTSQSHNLNIVGLALVSHFGIESASDMVASLVEQSTSHQVRAMAIDTLTSMHLPIAIPALRHYITTLRRPQRYSLLRHIAAAGYSEQSIKAIVTSDESQYYHSIVNSYKVKIECF